MRFPLLRCQSQASEGTGFSVINLGFGVFGLGSTQERHRLRAVIGRQMGVT
jgi:hypothetical protein